MKSNRYGMSYPTENSSEWVKSYTDFLGRSYRTTSSNGAFKTAYYNNLGQLIKQVDADNVTELYSYNARGQRELSAIDMNNSGTIETGTDRVVKTVSEVANKDGVIVSRQTASVYTDSGETVTSISESSVDGKKNWQTSFGRVTSAEIVYTGNGGYTQTVTNPDGSTVVGMYSNGKLLSSVHSILGTTSFTYDGFNRMLTQVDTVNGSSRTTTYTYDAKGRTTSIKLPDNREYGFTYDVMDRKTRETLPDNRTVNYTYALTGETTQISGADTYPVTYTYDALGRRVAMKTYNNFQSNQGETTTWTYTNGRLSAKVYPDSSSVLYTYTNAGRVLTRVWARGITTTYGYDAAGIQNSVTYSDGTTPAVAYTYNKVGQPSSVTDGIGTTSFTYNSDFSLASDGTVSYTYDSLGRRSGMTYGSNTTAYTYDGMSRLATVSAGNSSAAYSRVSGSSLLSSIAVTYNAVQALNTAKTYDNTDRLLSTISTFNSQTISRAYTYDASNRRTQATLEDSSKWNYTYDNMSQVLSGIKSGGTSGVTYAYTYDDIGNFKTERRNGNDYTYTTNNLNQYTSRTFPGVAKISGRANSDATVYIQKGTERPMKVSLVNGEFERTFKFDNSASAISQLFKIYAVKPGTTDLVKMKEQTVNIPKSPAVLTYDPDGNIVADGRFLYSWDGENRLVKTEIDENQKTENTFDYMGRRITKKIYKWVSGAWSLTSHIRFVYDSWLLVGEINGETSTVSKTYTWGEDISGSMQGAGGVGGLLSVTDSSGTYYPVYNGKDIIAYVNNAGIVVVKCEYDTFGKPVSVTGAKARDFNYLFSTKYYDWETGLYYHEERFYSPTLCRFLSRDPIEEEGGFNLCNYTGNNPVNNWDYLGRLLEKIFVPTKTIAVDYEFEILQEHLQDLKKQLEDSCPKETFCNCKRERVTPEECKKQAGKFAEIIVNTISYIRVTHMQKYMAPPMGGWTQNLANYIGQKTLGWKDEAAGGYGVQCNQWANELWLVVSRKNSSLNNKNAFEFSWVQNRMFYALLQHNWITIYKPKNCAGYGDINIDPWPTGGVNIYGISKADFIMDSTLNNRKTKASITAEELSSMPW